MQNITENSISSFDWSLKKAIDCGFEWSTTGDKFLMQAFLSANSFKFSSQNAEIIISTNADILLQCKYSKTVDLEKSLATMESNNTQNGDQTSVESFGGLFDLKILDSDSIETTSFTVGEQITAKVNFMIN